MFPTNLTLDEVRTVVREHNARHDMTLFIEADRGDHVIFNYLISTPVTFPPMTGDPVEDRKAGILRECRGITFDKASGLCIARKFQKFFNIGQNEESQASRFDFTRPHVIMDKLDGCLSADTTIDFCDGRKIGIAKVVKEKMVGPVWGRNEHGDIVPTLITNWTHNGFSDDWLKVKIEDKSVSAGYKVVTVTPNHEFQTCDNWERADKLVSGTALVGTAPSLNSFQRSVLLGMLAGDASLLPSGGSLSVQWCHKRAHRAYNDLKANVFAPFTLYRRDAESGYGHMVEHCRLMCARELATIRDLTYHGKKRLNCDWLNAMDALSFAFWYMDDGSLSRGANGQRPRALLHVEGYSTDEQEMVRKRLLDFGIDSTFDTYRNLNGEFRSLRMNADDATIFWDMIAPYVPEYMRYKLPESYDLTPCILDTVIDHSRSRVAITRCVLGVDCDSKRRGKWDIETETHNFSAAGAIVHNSMITPFRASSWPKARWGTKMGLTDVAVPVEAHVAANPLYEEFAHMCETAGFTPLFEWTSRQQRIVIDYPEDRLVLLHVRNIATGEYATREQVNALGEQYGIPVVKTLESSIDDIDGFIEMTRGLKNAEGYVVQFLDGVMLKLKADEYCLLHNTKETLNLEKNVIDLVLNDALDDLLPQMDAVDRDSVTRFLDDMMVGIAEAVKVVRETADGVLFTLDDQDLEPREHRKQYAMTVNSRLMLQPHDFFKGLMFRAYDRNVDLTREVISIIRDNVGSSTKVERIRPLIGGIKWRDYRGVFDADA